MNPEAAASPQEHVSFSPDLLPEDDLAVHWIRQVTTRLRREVSWSLNEHGLLPSPGGGTKLPPVVDKASMSLGMNRYWEDKKRFFHSDPTARYLTRQIRAVPPAGNNDPPRGSFSWVAEELDLDDTARFVLALGLTDAFDNAMGSVVSVCLNDYSKTRPTLALAQKLWDRPEDILQIADPGHPLFRFGLVHHSGLTSYHHSVCDWEGAITVPSPVAGHLLFPDTPLPPGLEPISHINSNGTDEDTTFIESSHLVAARLGSLSEPGLRVVPVLGPRGSGHGDIVRGITKLMNRDVVQFQGDPSFIKDLSYRNSLATLCWLRGNDLFFGTEIASSLLRDGHPSDPVHLPLESIPVTIFMCITDNHQLSRLPEHLLLPIVHVPAFTYKKRVSHWRRILGKGIDDTDGLDDVILECARRFRYEKKTIDRIARGLRSLPGPITQKEMTTACRTEFELDIGELAQKVTPRFDEEKLILPARQQRQFREIITAIRSLTRVHYEWGTAKAWNESGISVLFAGPPGTGKTMAAEILSTELDLPMYRIDLSQVVNKYIGETEKNLKKLFDTADISDIILFFDEADALFGRRTEVKDSHDRYANLEISYLLERMERFKGVCILATNRKKDLDEAFMRRLRYIVDFPPPGMRERKRIWEQVIPGTVDSSDVNIEFLARQFPLVGGHIRSIVFNACLQSTGEGSDPSDSPDSTDPTVHEGHETPADPLDGFKGKLRMKDVIVAVKREYDKLNRSVSLEHFGSYADSVRMMEGRDDEDRDR